jgi:hypothetical protein
MKNFIFKFKKLIRFIVSVFASREFAFIYCLIGTTTQVTHTYFLTYAISSFSGNFQHIQATLVAFFISSSLLYFVAIADNSGTKESKKIHLAINIFMVIEILINFYYYTRHLILDAENVQIFDFVFAVLISCLLPVTIKLYANTIQARSWITEMETDEPGITESGTVPAPLSSPDIEKLVETTIDQQLEKFKGELVTIAKESANYEEIYQKTKDSIINSLDADISHIFEKNQSLFLSQFENKCKVFIKKQLTDENIDKNLPENSSN